MTDHKEVMRMALEHVGTLRQSHYTCDDPWYSCPKSPDGCANEGQGDDCACGADEHNEMIDHVQQYLRAAIDEPVPEPVAWMIALPDGRLDRLSVVSFDDEAQEMLSRSIAGCTLVPLYAHPPAPPAADADAITVRLTRERHEELCQIVYDRFQYNMGRRDRMLAILGTFPDAAGKGEP